MTKGVKNLITFQDIENTSFLYISASNRLVGRFTVI